MLTKGDRFSATSPLSQKNKKFLLTFLISNEERVLSDEKMSRDQHKVIEAKGQEDVSRRNKAQRQLQSHWADQLNVELCGDKRVPGLWGSCRGKTRS